MDQASRKSSDVFNDDMNERVVSLSSKVFGRSPKRVAFPGGTSRSAFVADMGEAPFIFARRASKEDAQLEGIVLRMLGPTGYVPNLKAVVDDWVVQQCIPGVRLPVVLNQTSDMAQREQIVGKALESLVHIHESANNLNLQHRVPKVGTVDRWLWNRTGAAKRISQAINIQPPDLNREKLVTLMDVKRDEFVKWDARPGNAMVDDNHVLWFDWEDCGRSKALDDLAFVLCDEWTSLDRDAEARLKATYLPFFNRSFSHERAEHYLVLFGATHMILRLRMALKLFARDDEWWDRDYCLAGDKVGVTAEEVSRLISRLRRWSDGVEELQPLGGWLDQVAEHYDIG